MALTYNLADLWEAVVDRLPDRTALITRPRTLTYGELEDRANRLANWLRAQGVGPGDHVGLYLYNGTEYVEAMLAAYKLRAVPVNVNYRYVEDELRYLFVDADVVVIIHEDEFADRLAAIRADIPTLRTTLALGEYEAIINTAPADRPAVERSGDDHYVIYTGGTTGMPKGVVWRHEDAFFACFGGGDYMRRNPITAPDELPERLFESPLVFFPVAPLMHGAAQWTVLAWLFAGGTSVLATARPTTDYGEVWQLVSDHGVNVLAIVGDAVARPLLDEYHANRDRYDVSSLFSIGSGATPLSSASRAELQATFPNVILADGYGSSETGAQAGNTGDGRFAPYDDQTAVLDLTTRQPVAPGSGVEGRVARRGHIPLGYHKDPVKTAEAFVESGGERWVLTGDVATVLDDGTIQLFGRGSQCINTGGEKVFPEEIEGVLHGHPGVYDALVVGVPDARWGERVAAVVQPVAGATVGAGELDAHCRESVAAYKVPRTFVFVDRVERSPAGKPDYRWAKDAAIKASTESPVGRLAT